MQNGDDHDWLRQGGTSSADVAKSYDDWAVTYNETLAEWDYRAPGDAARLLRTTAPSDAVILDAGCGTGLTGAALRAAGFRGPIDGLDLSPASLEEAEKQGVYRDLRQANFQSLPLALAGNSYDALICVGVLTYVPDSAGILAEFARLVRPGGTVLATQRDDLFTERRFGETLASLASSGLIANLTITEPQPYLPANPDFGDAIKVIHATMSVV
ncbi:MAG: class I SAM-dependent methyltransferase [Alphaproteobacteria bacterium]|jgi:predicted TPR repeat methyltransferase